MCPLRPHLVFSSTGLNHRISSDEGRKKWALNSGKVKLLLPAFSNHRCLTSVEEHVTDDGGAAVDFERVSAEDNPLQHHALRIATEQTTCSHQVLDAWKDAETQTIAMRQQKSANPKSS